jgi:hypothetical protein
MPPMASPAPPPPPPGGMPPPPPKLGVGGASSRAPRTRARARSLYDECRSCHLCCALTRAVPPASSPPRHTCHTRPSLQRPRRLRRPVGLRRPLRPRRRRRRRLAPGSLLRCQSCPAHPPAVSTSWERERALLAACDGARPHAA